MNIRLAVVGSRTFNDNVMFNRIIEDMCNDNAYNITQIVSGGARGADSFGEAYADKWGIDKLIFKAEWDKYGKRAGFIRNVDIIKNCDVCVCFWDGDSHGTLHDIQLCDEYKKDCHVYNFVTRKMFYRYGESTTPIDDFINKCKQ